MPRDCARAGGVERNPSLPAFKGDVIACAIDKVELRVVVGAAPFAADNGSILENRDITFASSSVVGVAFAGAAAANSVDLHSNNDFGAKLECDAVLVLYEVSATIRKSAPITVGGWIIAIDGIVKCAAKSNLDGRNVAWRGVGLIRVDARKTGEI